jgi:hypothetical protein
MVAGSLASVHDKLHVPSDGSVAGKLIVFVPRQKQEEDYHTIDAEIVER